MHLKDPIGRKCAKCNIDLNYEGFIQANLHKYAEEYLFKLWQSRYLKFLCCNCYDQQYYKKEVKELTKITRTCRICGILLTFSKYRAIAVKIEELSLRSIISLWKSQESKVLCKKCLVELRKDKKAWRKKHFINLHKNEVEKVVKDLVPEEKLFIKELMAEVGQIIALVPKLEFIYYAFTIKEGHIKTLSLVNRGIETLPESIGNLTSLTTLFLDSNKLKELPDSMSNLKSLKILRLSRNKLKKLPHTFYKLSSLKQLNLDDNRFKNVPIVISGIHSLRFLDLSSNPIDELPDFFSSLPLLKILYIMCRSNLSIPPSLENLAKDKLMIVR